MYVLSSIWTMCLVVKKKNLKKYVLVRYNSHNVGILIQQVIFSFIGKMKKLSYYFSMLSVRHHPVETKIIVRIKYGFTRKTKIFVENVYCCEHNHIRFCSLDNYFIKYQNSVSFMYRVINLIPRESGGLRWHIKEHKSFT